jgi:DNA-binding MarR family transcriptional regulator
MAESPRSTGSSYWYDDTDPAVEILLALRAFRSADHGMRRRLVAGMGMNATDLAALRHVIAREAADDPATPRTVAQQLGISTASTTKLLNRLTDSGHLAREPHPRDRRSVTVRATAHAHEQIRERMTAVHGHMLEIARDVPADCRTAVVEFLLAMARQLDAEQTAAPLGPPGAARPAGTPQPPGATSPVS